MSEVKETEVIDPVLGRILVYRVYNPVHDEIEYTVFYIKDGERKRYDTSFMSHDFEDFTPPELEKFVRAKLLAGIDEQEGGYFTKMREVTRDEKFPDDSGSGSVEAELISTGPSETELVIVALLMRLYDVNMALLSIQSKATADKIYDTHAEGGHFNPPLFIPSLEQTDESTEN